MTYEFEKFVIDISNECSIEAIGRLYSISWDRCWNAVDRAVKRGQTRKEHAIPIRLGVNEKSFAKGHKYELVLHIKKDTLKSQTKRKTIITRQKVCYEK